MPTHFVVLGPLLLCHILTFIPDLLKIPIILIPITLILSQNSAPSNIKESLMFCYPLSIHHIGIVHTNTIFAFTPESGVSITNHCGYHSNKHVRKGGG